MTDLPMAEWLANLILATGVAMLLGSVGLATLGYLRARKRMVRPQARQTAVAPAPLSRDEEPRPLASLLPEQRQRFIRDWRALQAHAAASPADALILADVLIAQVLHACGHPLMLERAHSTLAASDSMSREDEIAHTYLLGHASVTRLAQGWPCEDEIRIALVRYQLVFDELVNEPDEDAPAFTLHRGRIVALDSPSAPRLDG
ncbi:hypothetical protein [Novosphingobium decolorationis]|uniref:DUF4760 domain-containing protein n=1 Tax=Novosphingobium decolorationis TaxID=2698673 RepID=A0ABX8EB00_9SPHN|nr:hypothetical protein [Novosphingobium decolorationis]QVM85376.1 hypothetical protein HT578_18235 [Novosphingobium decolorationis]